MSWLVALLLALVALGSVLACAEASISRTTRARALALREAGRRNAVLLERIESDPAPYLNSIYFAVMCAQNGSAILAALLAESLFGGPGIVLVSVAFTLVYFVVVEAMCKTVGILHSDAAALAVAPFVWLLGRLLRWPTRLLIGLANALLPGKGLERGPFATEQEIRSMADVGHEEGMLGEQEKDLIHSVFEFGDTRVYEVMVPRPDIVAVGADTPLRLVQELIVRVGRSRLPVYRGTIDSVEGIVHAKDVLSALHQGNPVTLADLKRPAHFVPGSKRIAELLREMQHDRFHLAIVVDEYGSVNGLVTLEDLLEELVGEIVDEHDREEPQLHPLGPGLYRASGRLPIAELSELLNVDLPEGDWNTVGGLVIGLLGAIPREGQEVQVGDVRLRAERVRGLRVVSVLVSTAVDDRRAAGPAEHTHREGGADGAAADRVRR